MYLKYQWATAPATTRFWHPVINSDTHIKAIMYTHHMYLTQTASTYSTRVSSENLPYSRTILCFLNIYTKNCCSLLENSLIVKLDFCVSLTAVWSKWGFNNWISPEVFNKKMDLLPGWSKTIFYILYNIIYV